MKEFKTKITINAPIEKVWEIFSDFENYQKWNPFITSLKGNSIVGEKLEVQIVPEGSKPMLLKPILLKNEFQNEFRWKGSLGIKGIFDGEHYFKFEKLPNGSTQFIHGEIFTGILVKPILALVGKGTLGGFNTMNKSLKQIAETN